MLGNGIAVKNATVLCKLKANKVSEWTNNENAVAKEIELLLKQDKFHLVKGNIKN